MFTGIVQGTALVVGRAEAATGLRLRIELPEPLAQGLELGMSVSVDGVCLTVAALEDQVVSFDVIPTTLEVTNLGDRALGDYVNVERSLKLGQENGGHEVTGHVSGVAIIRYIELDSERRYIRFQVAPGDEKYFFDKGFIALNGASLTVAENGADNIFNVNLIPETLRQTTFGNYRIGDRLNYEVEHRTRVIVDTVERVLALRTTG